jgi:hypothetical protein
MFDIDNLINSPIVNDPWDHQIIKNFFGVAEFKTIQNAAINLYNNYQNSTITADNCLSIAQAFDDIGTDAFDIILETNQTILDNLERITKNFPRHRRFKNYISIPTFHILPPNLLLQKVHDEAYDKTASIVVYLYPESSVGTALYRTQSRDSLVKEVEWKSNTAMLFCGEKETTWHDFYTRNNPRVSLNFFLRNLESNELLETETDISWKHLDGPPTLIPKHLPASIISKLTGGILERSL